jgi:hypothetical protein
MVEKVVGRAEREPKREETEKTAGCRLHPASMEEGGFPHSSITSLSHLPGQDEAVVQEGGPR